jgi:hypothetical protein
MAHFLEHMLFLGTQKYARAGSGCVCVCVYDSALVRAGGQWRACVFCAYYVRKYGHRVLALDAVIVCVHCMRLTAAR